MTLRYKQPCPTCFSETGYSVVMEQKDDRFHCPNNINHRFKRSADGFWVKA